MRAHLKHPTVEAVLAIHAEVLAAHGGGVGIRSMELLESAIAAPQATMMGSPMISEPIEIAAAYLFYLCSNHPFVDGNEASRNPPFYHPYEFREFGTNGFDMCGPLGRIRPCMKQAAK